MINREESAQFDHREEVTFDLRTPLGDCVCMSSVPHFDFVQCRWHLELLNYFKDRCMFTSCLAAGDTQEPWLMANGYCFYDGRAFLANFGRCICQKAPKMDRQACF